MKILFICLPRTGSTSLFNALSKAYKLNRISTPDTFRFPRDRKFIEECKHVENIIFRISPSHDIGDSLANLSLYFTHTILLSRRSEKEHFESLVNLYFRETSTFSGFHSSYVYQDIPPHFSIKFSESKDWQRIKKDREVIKNLAVQIDTELLFYEDLYYFNNKSSLFTSLGTPKLKQKEITKELNSTKKLRKTSTKSLI